MKNRAIQILVMTAIPALTSYCQGTFQNLDFESANIQPGQLPGLVNATDAIPGWIPYVGTNEGNAVLFNQPSLSLADVVLYSAPSSIEGDFGVLLQGGLVNRTGEFVREDASIRQTGLVPVGTQSVQFKASGGAPVFAIGLFVGGQSVPVFTIATSAAYTLYGGDVSQFSGQVEELRIAALASASYPFPNVLLDSIEFSSQAIPEPGTLALLGLALVACAICKDLRA